MEEIKQAEDRLKVLERIKDYELNKRFNDDVEEDDPAITIKPKDVDYTIKKLSSKILTGIANFVGKTYFEIMIKKHCKK